MERLKRMLVFAKVVEFGSFTSAARQLNMSISAVSQTVTKLEQELQIRLLNRSTRSTGLTEAGNIYYQGCAKMLHAVREVHDQLYSFNNTPTGLLRIGSSCAMAQNVLAGITAALTCEYPGLRVELFTGARPPDLIAQGLDIVICSGALQDSSLFSKRLGNMRMVICAAASLLARHAPLQLHNLPETDSPYSPQDTSSLAQQLTQQLNQYGWLQYSMPAENQVELTVKNGTQLQLVLEGRFITNDALTLIRWLQEGTGIACVPRMWVADALARQQLHILLPQYAIKPRPVYALYTKKSQLPLKVQVCINALTAWFHQHETRE